MAAYLLRRSALSVVVLMGISMVIFFLLHLVYPAPGLDVLGIQARPAQVAAWNRDHGFTQPVIVQYCHYLDRLLHGDLGYSYKLNQSITQLFAERWMRSLYLSGASLLLALLVTIPLGAYQAVRRNHLGDRAASGLQFALYATPDYLLYLLAIQVLAFDWPVLPYQASQSDSLPAVIADWRSMTLPIGCSALLITAGFSRYFRSAALDTLGQDYIMVARAKGLPERLVLSRHLVRNACLPMTTLIGLSIPALIAYNFAVKPAPPARPPAAAAGHRALSRSHGQRDRQRRPRSAYPGPRGSDDSSGDSQRARPARPAGHRQRGSPRPGEGRAAAVTRAFPDGLGHRPGGR